jgi:phosphatidate cytidylyltransferase
LSHWAVSQTVLLCLAGLYGILAVASLALWSLRWRIPGQEHAELVQRIRSWWIIVSLFTAALVLSRRVSIGFFALVSFLALKEYLTIIPTHRADRRVMFWVYLAIPLQYYWVAQAWYGMFIIFIPVYVFLLLPLPMVMIGETQAFLHSAASLNWGIMTFVFAISHVAYLLVLPLANNPTAGGAGLVLFLVFLTQFNDVAQYCWGRMLGRHKIVPKVSPNKTWEGFLGGVATTAVLAALLAGVLTPMPWRIAALAGIMISCAGFLGDVTISALKRDIGLKDTGNLLPGHGGILDRIDSLTYTAPLFFHFVHYFYY